MFIPGGLDTAAFVVADVPLCNVKWSWSLTDAGPAGSFQVGEQRVASLSHETGLLREALVL